MRQKERNKTRFYDRDQQVVNMEEEEGILFSRGVEVHVDKCLRFYCGRSPKTPTSLIRYTIYSKPKRLSQIFK